MEPLTGTHSDPSPGVTTHDRPDEPPRIGGRYRIPILAWSGIATTLLLLQFISARGTRDAEAWSQWYGMRYFLSGWVQFDGHVYLSIAQDGYWYRPASRAPVVFFPLYPIVIRLVRPLVGDPLLAGVVVSSLAGLAATVLFWRWAADRGLTRRAQLMALGVLLLYPYGWYLFGVVYSDALFVLLVIAAFGLVEAGRPGWATVVGALATATRPTGVALVAGLMVLALERDGRLVVPSAATGWRARWQVPTQFLRRERSLAPFATVLSAGGVVAYSGFLWARFGNPLLWLTDQSQYHGSGWRTLLKEGLVGGWVYREDPLLTLTCTIQALVALGVLCSVPAVGRRFGWGYAVFVGVLVMIPTISTENFLGTGRYLMAAFPVAALVGERIEGRPAWWRSWFLVSAIGLMIGTMGFARSQMLT